MNWPWLPEEGKALDLVSFPFFVLELFLHFSLARDASRREPEHSSSFLLLFCGKQQTHKQIPRGVFHATTAGGTRAPDAS
jgi:hypothetical protein